MADIVDTAIAAGSFKTLVEAIQVAGLIQTLKGKDTLTVFAPTDKAFAKLPKSAVENLFKLATPKLKMLLTYHVIPGKVMASDIAKMSSVKTLQGQNIKIDASKWHLHKSVKINDANIVKADIVTDNGVIHVIDKVLLPK